MIEENLAKLGFSPSERTIYLHLVKTGNSYPKKISAETGINRTNVYEALDRLISKGVISFIIKNKLRWFEAKSSNSLISLIDEKEEEIKKTKSLMLYDIKQMKLLSNNSTLEANIFTGKKGLRMIFEEILEKQKPIYLMASQLQFEDLFGPYFELWHKKRIALGITQRSIFSNKFKQKLKTRRLLKYKFVNDKFMSPTTTIIYDDTCIFIQWSKEPVAIKINNKEIVKSHTNYFNMIWES
jgi:sugar-specific transcriptional regulator TrmB